MVLTYDVTKVDVDLVSHAADRTWLESADWYNELYGITDDGERVSLMKVLTSAGYDSLEYKHLMAYHRYAADRVRRGLPVVGWDIAMYVPLWTCLTCGNTLHDYSHRGPDYWVMCDRHPNMRRPTYGEKLDLTRTHEGPAKPHLIDLLEIYRGDNNNGNLGLACYEYMGVDDFGDDDRFDLAVLQYNSVHQVRRDYLNTHGISELMVEVPHTAWGDHIGDSITRANFEYWADQYKDLQGQCWWVKESGFSTVSVMVMPRLITDEMFEDIAGLDGYCVLDDSKHSEVEQALEEAAWDSYVKYEWSDHLREAGQQVFKNHSDVDKARATDAIEEAIDTDDGKELFWTCIGRACDSGSSEVWLYEDAISATLRSYSDVAEQLEWADLFPPDPNQLTLPTLEREDLEA